MGWNELRISLVPGGRTMIARIDPATRTTTGEPVAILSTITDVDAVAASLDPRALRHVLEQEGFDVSQQGDSFLRMKREEIEAFLAVDNGALSEIILTFTLNRSSPSLIPDWQNLISRLLRSDGLALVDRTTRERVGCRDFPRLLTKSPVWREFAKRYDWPEAAREQGGWPVEVGPSGNEPANEAESSGRGTSS